MQVGSFTLEVLSEGRFEMFRDGHINRSSPDEDRTSMQDSVTVSAESNIVGINPILVKTGPQNILLDAGLGWGLDAHSEYVNVSNVKTNLEIFQLSPADITHVILSHLHYDHAAGCSFTDGDSKTRATFPNATYYVHQKEWDYALSRVDSEQHTNYKLDEFYRLVADDRVEFLSKESNEIINGISTLWTGGHTPGHQIVIIENNGDLSYFLGDLLPTSSQLNHYNMSRLDVDPIQAKKKKIKLLRKACKEQALLLFYHSKYGQSGRLIKNKDKQYALTEITRS
ncbi:MAG TPA: MBL fold metallo-hydrolase [Balneolaceae bacterium]|nr:MBL fold metallo-hydrolase [Balneolaceae bacterium]